MRPHSPRVVVALLVVAALLAPTPAVAAPAKPPRVGHVTFVAASLTPAGATLTIDWGDVKGATSYEVFAAPSADGVAAQKTPRMTVTESRATVTGLKKGADYFVQVRAVNAAGAGLRSQRLGHGTMVAESKEVAALRTYQALTWNVCSYQCSGIAKRTKVINSRIAELKPDIVGLQEASRYSKAPTGYRFVVDGQNDILVRTGQFTVVKKKKNSSADAATSGKFTYARKHATPGKGGSWAALKHKSGSYVVVVNTHLLAGTGKAQEAQREYEAARLAAIVKSTLAKLKKHYGTLTDWTKAPVILLGDFNSHKSRPASDRTMAVLEKAGWYDAFDQARKLSKQHFNTANPTMKAAPVRGGWWGDHVDKVLVRPSRSIVYTWANVGKYADGRFVTPLGSDHHPLMVKVAVR